MSIENLIMSREFAEAHTVRVNPLAPYQMTSLDGRRMLLSEDRRTVTVLPGEASRPLFDPAAADLSVYWDRETNVFEQERRAMLLKTSRADQYVILREGSVELGVFGGKGAIPVLLVSHPLKPRPPHKSWATHPATLGFDTSVDPFLAMSPIQGSSPREMCAESEDEVVDRIQSVFAAAAGGNGLPRAVPPQSAQALDWIFEMGAVKSVTPSSGAMPAAFPAAASASSSSSSLPAASQTSLARQPSAVFSEPPPPPAKRETQNKAEKEREERERRERLKAMFFEKMKHRKAADLVQSIKTFVTQFVEKPPLDTDRKAEVVRNYLQGLEDKIRQHTVWQGASDEELEEMSETLERFVMSKIYRVIFAPASSDLERDEKLQQRIQLLASWLEPRHLDINLDLSNKRSARVMGLAVDQLQKWNTFKAPRDKMVCILNSCKAVWKLLGAKTDGKPAGADDFLPHLIFVVIRANPPNLYSTVEYISRYRHPDKMAQEFGYYFTQLASVVPFLEGLTHKSFSVSEEEYNRNMRVRVTTALKSSSSSSELPRTGSSVSLWDLPSSAPINRAVMEPKPSAQMQRAVSMSALVEHQPQAPTSAPLLPAAQPPAPRRNSLPAATFRFVGRDVSTLTMAEVKELFAAYEALAKTFV